MKGRYEKKIPGKPILRRETYIVPDDYLDRYEREGVRDSNQQVILFHLTQFGGFRLERIPNWFYLNGEFKSDWLDRKKEGSWDIYRAGPGFIRTFGDIQVGPLQRKWRKQVLKEKDMIECGYSPEDIDDVRTFLDRLNEFYSTLKIGIDIPNSGISAEDRVQLSRFHAVPFLTVRPFAGGRFFHPETSYQRISSALRPFMRINGENATEIDLSAATLQFMNIALEKEYGIDGSIGKIVLDFDDPYQYFLSEINSEANLSRDGWKEIDREQLKKFLYTLVYSSENRQKSNLNRKLSRFGTWARYSDFVNLFKEFFSGFSNLRLLADGEQLHMVINREESTFTRKVLERGCLDEEIPILPIHDSFITTDRHYSDLESIIDESAEELYGRNLKHKRKF